MTFDGPPTISISSTHNGRALFPYQVAGVEQIVNRFKHVLLADVPGAGKTAQAIVACDYLGAKTILVICPASLRANWSKEFSMWSEYRRREAMVLSTRDAGLIESAALVLVSYDLAAKEIVTAALIKRSWDVLILDECHYLKGRRSKRSRVIRDAISKHAGKILAISGTPLPNGRAIEAYPVFSMLDFERFGKWPRFIAEWTYPEANQWGVNYDRSKNLKELGRIARERFMIRRPKEEVLGQLPPLIRQTIPLAIEDKKLEALADESLELINEAEGLVERGEPPPAHIATARRQLGIAKVTAAGEFIENLLTEEKQVVVMAHHREVLDLLLLYFAVTPHVTLRGETSPAERQAAVEKFQGGKVRLFFGSIQAAGVGITLTAASALVMVEASWVPGENDQCEARIRRVTQDRITRAFYLTVRDSLDDAITGIVLRKQRDIKQVLGDVPAQSERLSEVNVNETMKMEMKT